MPIVANPLHGHARNAQKEEDMTMHKQIQIMILPLAAYGAIVGFTAQLLHHESASCAAHANAPAATAKACGQVEILKEPDKRAIR